jgi:hypothetical protein
MVEPSESVTDSQPPSAPRPRRFEWPGQLGPALWTVASVLSLIVNVILIAVVLTLLSQIFAIKSLVGDQLIGGLYDNFVKMDQAHIRTNIQVNDTIQVDDQIQVNDQIKVQDTIVVEDTIPVVFTLPLNQVTSVVLTQNTPVNDATVYLNGSAVTTDLVLRQGTRLNIRLSMDIPVSQELPVKLNVPVDLDVPVNLDVPVHLTVPVSLNVPVDIPLAETELHEPFVGLQEVLSPYRDLMQDLPGSWDDVICGPLPDSFCD